MTQLKSLFFDTLDRGLLGEPLIRDVDGSIRQVVANPQHIGHADERTLPPETFQAMLNCWVSLHGFASLETYRHPEFLPPEAATPFSKPVYASPRWQQDFPAAYTLGVGIGRQCGDWHELRRRVRRQLPPPT